MPCDRSQAHLVAELPERTEQRPDERLVAGAASSEHVGIDENERALLSRRAHAAT